MLSLISHLIEGNADTPVERHPCFLRAEILFFYFLVPCSVEGPPSPHDGWQFSEKSECLQNEGWEDTVSDSSVSTHTQLFLDGN